MPSGEPIFGDAPALGSGTAAPETQMSSPAIQEPASTPEMGSTPSAPTEGSVNWDDPSNPYRQQATEWENRFKGLQPTVQRYAEELRSVREQQAQIQEQAFLSNIRYLDPVTQQQRLSEYRTQQQVVAERQRLQEESSAVEALAREIFPLRLQQQYGIPVQELAKYNDPREMEIRAQAWKEYQDQLRLTQTQTQRQAMGADNFEPTERSAAIPRQKTSNWDQASQNLQEELRRVLR